MGDEALRQDRNWFLKGNHSFLQFKRQIKVLDPDGSCNAEAVLEHLVDFEERNPNLRVTDWKPENSFAEVDSETGVFCFGIWIDHEPRVEEQD